MINPPPSRNRIGTISLAIAFGGFLVCEAAHHFQLVAGPWWLVVRSGFEAALIGGIADWFAVTALFRRVPNGKFALPHTDIIVRNRAKLTDGVVDLVENQLLSPASVREKLQDFSISQVLFEQLEDQTGREMTAATLRLLASHVSSELEDHKLREFLTALLREQIKTANLAPLWGRWLQARVQAGDTIILWQTLAASLAEQAERGDLDELIRDLLQLSLQAYKNELRGIATLKGWIASIAIDSNTDTRRLRDGLVRTLRSISHKETHPLSAHLDAAVRNYAADLQANQPEATARVFEFQQRLAENPDLDGVVGHMLSDLRKLAEAKLSGPNAEFDAAITDLIERGLTRLKADQPTRTGLDRWAREALENIVTRHHGIIGSTARHSLNRLDDRELVSQMEAKVGNDLQYIRLNGAMIGGLVGVILMTTKLLLGWS